MSYCGVSYARILSVKSQEMMVISKLINKRCVFSSAYWQHNDTNVLSSSIATKLALNIIHVKLTRTTWIHHVIESLAISSDFITTYIIMYNATYLHITIQLNTAECQLQAIWYIATYQDKISTYIYQYYFYSKHGTYARSTEFTKYFYKGKLTTLKI